MQNSKEHNVGDLVCYENGGLGMITKIDHTRIIPYAVRWFEEDETYSYDSRQIVLFKRYLSDKSQSG